MEPQTLNALIVGLFNLASIVISCLLANKLTAYRIEQLEKKVDKHNNLIERMYRVEEKTELIDHEIQHIKENMKE